MCPLMYSDASLITISGFSDKVLLLRTPLSDDKSITGEKLISIPTLLSSNAETYPLWYATLSANSGSLRYSPPISSKEGISVNSF